MSTTALLHSPTSWAGTWDDHFSMEHVDMAKAQPRNALNETHMADDNNQLQKATQEIKRDAKWHSSRTNDELCKTQWRDKHTQAAIHGNSKDNASIETIRETGIDDRAMLASSARPTTERSERAARTPGRGCSAAGTSRSPSTARTWAGETISPFAVGVDLVEFLSLLRAASLPPMTTTLGLPLLMLCEALALEENDG